MKRVLCGLLMALASHTVLAEEIVTPAEPFTGWSWYNEPKKPPEQSRKPQQPAPQAIPDLSKMSPMEQARVLKGYTQEALNRAILFPRGKTRRRSCAGRSSGPIGHRCSASPLRRRS
jgi:conjugal transfer pilus assembly protein TraF